MQQQTSISLYQYWDEVRRGRIAPNRFEIEPSDISSLLADTFIIDCSGASSYRFRLAGTQICEHLGRELRGTDLLDLWGNDDRDALESLLYGVVQDASVGVARFDAIADTSRRAQFELTAMPLQHSSPSVNRILGSITAIDPPYWLGSVAINSYQLSQVDIIFPDGKPNFLKGLEAPAIFENEGSYRIAGDNIRRFRVFEGGRSSAE